MGAKTKHEFVLIGKDQASNVIKGVSKTTAGFIDTTHKLTSVMSNSINILGAVTRGIKALGGAMSEPIKLAIEQVRVESQLAAVLKSTGEAAGLNAGQLKDMAKGLQDVTTFGDETIIGAQNMLLTFTNIGGAGGIFERTTKTVLDVATAMQMDLKSASVQVGKALNDPATGLSMLTRVGITFSETQKELIKDLQKMGDTAGAQTVILDELERQFGGSAAAAKDTFGGALKSLSNQWGDLLEAAGSWIVQNEGVRRLIDEITSGVSEWSESISDLSANSEGQTKIAEVMRSTMIGILELTQSLATAFAYLAEIIFDGVRRIAELRGETIGLTKEQRELAATSEEARLKFEALGGAAELYRLQAKNGTEQEKKLKEELQASQKVMIDSSLAFNQLRDDAGDFTGKAEVLTGGIQVLIDRLREVDVTATETGESIEVVAASVNHLKESVEDLGSFDFAKLNSETFTYLDALKRDLPDVSSQWTKLYLDLKKNISDLPFDEQAVELQKFHDALSNMYERAVGGSAEAAAGMNQYSVSAEEAAKAVEKLGDKAADAAAKAAEDTAKAAEDAAKAAEKGRREEADRYAKSVENAANQSADAWNDAFKSVISGQENMRTAFGGFAEGFGDQMRSALIDPIMGAEGPLQGLFQSALQPIMDMGQAIASELFAPMVEGLKNYFMEKFGLMQADAVAEVAVNQTTSTAVTAQNVGAASVSAAAWTPAAIMSSIATLGAALAFGFLVSTVISKVMGYEEGGFIDKAHLAMVGEGNKPEVIIPLSKPDRARQLLAETFERHPGLFLSAMGGKGGVSSGGSGGTNNFTITVNGAGDPSRTSAAIVNKIDQMLGMKLRGRI